MTRKAGAKAFQERLGNLRELAETALIADILRGHRQIVAGQTIYSNPAEVYQAAVQYARGGDRRPATLAGIRQAAREVLGQREDMAMEGVGILYDINGRSLSDLQANRKPTPATSRPATEDLLRALAADNMPF